MGQVLKTKTREVWFKGIFLQYSKEVWSHELISFLHDSGPPKVSWAFLSFCWHLQSNFEELCLCTCHPLPCTTHLFLPYIFVMTSFTLFFEILHWLCVTVCLYPPYITLYVIIHFNSLKTIVFCGSLSYGTVVIKNFMSLKELFSFQPVIQPFSFFCV